jgi:F-type H+-transporting ATPase subunit gamma
MAGSKEIRTKIKSVQNTQDHQGDGNGRRIQDAQGAERMWARPYADKVRNIAAHMSEANPSTVIRS